jgi:hypothetical protein
LTAHAIQFGGSYEWTFSDVWLSSETGVLTTPSAGFSWVGFLAPKGCLTQASFHIVERLFFFNFQKGKSTPCGVGLPFRLWVELTSQIIFI